MRRSRNDAMAEKHMFAVILKLRHVYELFMRVVVYHRRLTICISPQQLSVFICILPLKLYRLNKCIYIYIHIHIFMMRSMAMHGMEQRISSTNAYDVDTSCIDAWLMGEGLFLRATGAAPEEQRPLPSLQCLRWGSGRENGWMRIQWGYMGVWICQITPP